MKRTLPLVIAAVALAAAATKTYTIKLFHPTVAGSAELQPGEHKLQLVDGNAFIIDGKAETRTPVKVETGNEKYGQTSIRLVTDGAKTRIQEIRLGGGSTKLVVGESGGGSGASSGAAATSN